MIAGDKVFFEMRRWLEMGSDGVFMRRRDENKLAASSGGGFFNRPLNQGPIAHGKEFFWNNFGCW